jgi:predicted small lipoprotein YifL
MPVRTLIIVLLAVAALAGCGRRGPLEDPGVPPSAGAVAAPPTNVSPLDPGSTVVPVPKEQQPAPRRRFLLDFLL